MKSSSESDSDSAPEETGFSSAQLESKQRLREQQDIAAASARAAKNKRRERDSVLKAQSRGSKKLLSEVLQEIESEEDEPLYKKPIVTHKPVKKTFELEKNGVTVRVVKATNKKQPPRASPLVARRDKFLRRSANVAKH